MPSPSTLPYAFQKTVDGRGIPWRWNILLYLLFFYSCRGCRSAQSYRKFVWRSGSHDSAKLLPVGAVPVSAVSVPRYSSGTAHAQTQGREGGETCGWAMMGEMVFQWL